MTTLVCSLPLIASLFSSCDQSVPLATGYVEGEYVLIAAIETDEIASLLVARGDHVNPGQTLAEMDKRSAEIALAQAEAALAQAEAQLADLKEGKRPEEIAVIEADLASAQAQAKDARRTSERIVKLTETGSATTAQRDDALTAADVANARVASSEAALAVAQLPARPQIITAAEAQLTIAKANRDHAAWALGKRQLTAPTAGTITDIIRRPGEVAGPSAPVLSLLPDGGVKLQLYIGEDKLASVHIGSTLQVRCDGCTNDLSAIITYVSDQPEFTPPVIYSLENRQKLVFLIEAKPVASATGLKPGQIVDVDLSRTGE